MGMKKTKAWITKYALTLGIICELGEYDRAENMLIVYDDGTRIFYGHDFHFTVDLAKMQANIMRKKKIQTLKNQIVELEGMTFDLQADKEAL